MGSRGTLEETKGQRTRARLLRAAEDVFGRRGFRDASISAITREAGVAQGSFYLYFSSKQAAFAELMHARAAELRAIATNGGDGQPPGIARERACLVAVFNWIKEHRWSYRVSRELEFVDPELCRTWYHGLLEAYSQRILLLMERGCLPKGDPVHIALMIVGAVELAALRWLVWSAESADGELQLAAYVEVTLRALGLT